ncbi:MAG: P-loop NTPase, partial [Acidimicrobiia bacterium]|nr:P-loop NTPase [Acidimicrobiia bacterium]
MSSFFAEEGSDWFDQPASAGDAASIETAAPSPTDAAPAAASIATVVVDRDPGVQADLAAKLGGVPTFASIEELAARLTGAPVVAVLGPTCSHPEILVASERVLSYHAELGTVLVADELSTSLLQQALRSGVKDVLASPVDPGELLATIERVGATLQPITGSSTPLGDTPAFDELGEGAEPGQVITVFSTKGGAGKSIIATNLAVSLARRSDRPVCLIDADLQFGDIAVMLKLAPQHTIVDAVASGDRLDETFVQNLLTVHESSGLLVLPAPLEPAFADQIG